MVTLVRPLNLLLTFSLALDLAGCASRSDAANAGATNAGGTGGGAAPGVAGAAAAGTAGQPALGGAGGDAGGAGTQEGAFTERERAALGDEPPHAARLADTPSSMGHFAPARQASTFRAGPEQPNGLTVQVLDLPATTGFEIGTSPWHVVSPNRYNGSATTVWGVDLRYLYKLVVNGERFEVGGVFQLNPQPTSIPWNLIALADGRVIVPDSDGFEPGDAGDACRTQGPAFLAFRDDGVDPKSKIECERALRLEPVALRRLCGVGPTATLRAGSGTNLGATFTGELVTVATFDDTERAGTYAVVFDDALTEVRACGFIDAADLTNQMAAEPLGGGRTAMYYATDSAIVKLTYDHAARAVSRVWARQLSLRFRTGTTPTLLDAPNGDRLVFVIDAPCAVSNVLNGLIVCDSDTSPARIIAVRREDELPAGTPETISAELPAFIRTVENSPAARRDLVVVANYSGYVPNGLEVPPGGQAPTGGPTSWGVSPDAVAHFAPGIVALRYAPKRSTFEVVWANAETQVSGVPTISAGANFVYGTGAEEADQKLYLYGFLLEADGRGPAGTRVIRQELGRAPFRTPQRDARGNLIYRVDDYRFSPGELFDMGNNLLVLEDRSLLFPGGRAVVRIR